MDSDFSQNWRLFIDMMTSPQGIVGLVGVFALFVALLFSPRLKWPAISFMLFVSTAGFQVRIGEQTAVQLLFPLNIISNQGRPICGAILLALLVPTVMGQRGWRRHVVGLPLALFFVFELFVAARITAGGVTDRGVLSLLLYLLMFAV